MPNGLIPLEQSTPLRIVVVDDETRARRILETLLLEYCQNIEVVGHAGSVAEAILIIESLEPDLVFLDIEMPGQQGFALFEHFPKPTFQVVFTTAYQQYALQAFEVSADDYLLKPIEIERLTAAVEKVRKKVYLDRQLRAQANTSAQPSAERPPITRLRLSLGNGEKFVNVKDIYYLEADGAYTHVVLQNSKILVTKPIGQFKELDNNREFFKSHRSYLVNLQLIESYVHEAGGYLRMANGHTVSLSRYKREAFLKAIQSL